MRKIIYLFLSFLVLSTVLHPTQPMTVAERSGFRQTSRYDDVIQFIFSLQKSSDKIAVTKLTDSFEGRMIPLVIISQRGIRSLHESRLYPKPVVLINANIHAGEVEGKEAVLMLMRDFAHNRMDALLDNQHILIIPIFNPDGNEKIGHNRRDNGPELAGVRYNGQHLDLNRDFLKLESPEVQALVRLFNRWDPILFVDLHTTNGSFHREPVTYSTQINPNTDPALRDYMWNKLFPEVARTLKKQFAVDSVPYGNYVDRFQPEKGWVNWATHARFGFNYLGLRNRFSILNENYAHADFKTRVLSCLGFLKSILLFTGQHIQDMKKLAARSDLETVQKFSDAPFALESKTEKLCEIRLQSYEFKKVKLTPEEKKKYPPWYGDYRVEKTDKQVDYTLPYFAQPVAKTTTSLPRGYIVLPHHPGIIKKLEQHGLIMEKTVNEFKTTVEEIHLDEIKPSTRIYQGHIRLECKTRYESREMVIPAGSHLVLLDQPLSRLIPVLLEPESGDSLFSWGFFNREIISQWTNRPQRYPIYRLRNGNLPVRLVGN